MVTRPFVGDNEEIDTSPARAPRANIPKNDGKSKREPRCCWITLPRPWLRLNGNFMRHLFGYGNIRFRNITYASLCHHPTTHWDTHPLCWQCYKDLDLPFCGLDMTIECEHCDRMGKAAHMLRNERLQNGKPRNYAAKTGLPINVYNQRDADVWHDAKNIKLWPNPDWITPGQPIGNCFPAQLVPESTLRRAKLNFGDQWRDEREMKRKVEMHNVSDREIKGDPKTESEREGLTVPSCLLWTPEWKPPCPVPTTTDQPSTSQVAVPLTTPAQLPTATSVTASQSAPALGPGPELLSMLQAVNQQPTVSMETLTASMNTYFTNNNQLLQYLVNKVLNTQTTSSKPPHISDEDWAATAALLSPSEVAAILGPNVPQFNEADINSLSVDQRGQLMLQQQATTTDPNPDLMPQQGPAHDEATFRRRQEYERTTATSPYFAAKTEMPPIQHKYEEMRVSVDDWSARVRPDMEVPVNAEIVDGPLTTAINRLVEAVPDLDWNVTQGQLSSGEDFTTFSPPAETVTLSKYLGAWRIARTSNPMNIDLGWPKGLGRKQGLEPGFQYKQLKHHADVNGKLPSHSDYMFVSQSEVEYMRQYSNAAVTLQNMVTATSKYVSYVLSDVSIPLEISRNRLTLLNDVTQQASAVLAGVLARQKVMSTLLVRRDNMTRAGLNLAENEDTLFAVTPTDYVYAKNTCNLLCSLTCSVQDLFILLITFRFCLLFSPWLRQTLETRASCAQRCLGEQGKREKTSD